MLAEQEQLRTTLAAATADRDHLSKQVEALEQRLSDAERVHARVEALSKDRDEAAGELTKLRADLAQHTPRIISYSLQICRRSIRRLPVRRRKHRSSSRSKRPRSPAPSSVRLLSNRRR
jgi:seryl-tRNA synthetase